MSSCTNEDMAQNAPSECSTNKRSLASNQRLMQTPSDSTHEDQEVSSTLSTVHSGIQEKASTDNEYPKFSRFSASIIRIGSWEVFAEREDDLVAKFHYGTKKMVWEISKDGLKSRIEIQWSQVLAFKASMVEGQPGILEIELSSPPAFYRLQDNPRPRQHPWKTSSDFTDGQAPIHRRHYLEFPPGALDKHYERLIQRDSRMLVLSRSTFPRLSFSPFFRPEDHLKMQAASKASLKIAKGSH